MATALKILRYPAWFNNPTRGCAEPGDVQFFPTDFEEHRRRTFDAKPAKRMCRHCPFMNKCLEWSLDNDQKYGVWGGKDERERRAIVRCRKGQCGTRCTHPYRLRRI